MDEERRRDRVRSFVLGGLVGAAGALAAARRLRPPAGRPPEAPAGLAAFESSPCFQELERERGT